ncbi:MAG: TetR/AcrR family transcriptional regulator [Nitrosomonadales bacterium]|nr:TetR/AcrR family transcriptional regulator [Nitrosomonadales bacterium]
MNMMITNRDRLLLAARELFLEHGYDASVDAIIAHAGVARQTFYNHFRNKESLFAEVVRDCFLDVIAPLNEHPDELRQSLLIFAQAYRQRALSPAGVSSYRVLSGQAQRFPALVREAYTMGAGQIIERLASFLRMAMEEKKLLDADPVFAAEMLMAMVVGQERTHLLFGIQRKPEDEQRKMEYVVDGFLRMFAPQCGI